MRILWFTNTPSRAAADFGYKSFGGGWISALETIVAAEGHNQLGICFFYDGSEYRRVEKNNVVYYGLPFQKENAINRVISRHKGHLNDDTSEFTDQVLQDFKPDLIHVFGTEAGYARLLKGKFSKVVFHLQGLVAPYSEVYFPPVLSPKQALYSGNWKDLLRGLTFHHQYRQFRQRAQRELETLRNWTYFTGRTHWDRNYALLINPNAQYFHCEELLRADFFEASWSAPAANPVTEKLVIGTTINPNIYKGLDLIYKVLPLLEQFNVEWKLFGIGENSELNRVIKNAMGIHQPVKGLHFCGPTGAANLIQELNGCHFFVHPSYIDNSPNSVCEAQLLGMPVISSAVGGVSSLITNNENGFLFNPQDRYDLAGLIAWLAHHYDLAIEAGRKARSTAQDRHDPKKLLNTLHAMYQTIHHG